MTEKYCEGCNTFICTSENELPQYCAACWSKMTIPVVTGIAKQDSPKLTNGQDLTEASITFMAARSVGLVKQMLKDKMATEIFKGLIQQGIV